MKFKYQLVILLALVILAGGFALPAEPFNRSTDSDIVILPKESKESTREEALPEGRKLFVDPDGRFSFQYESNGNDYRVEPIYRIDMNSPNLYSVCDGHNCYSVGVEAGPFRTAENGRPAYDYKRLTYDRESPDSYEPLLWNGYPAYKAVFTWQDYPERYLFIHIPHGGQLFTLYRSTKNTELEFRQFRVISETFRLLN
jgi:hypothetical protein